MVKRVRPSGVGASRWRTAAVLLVATLTPLLIYALISIGIGYRDDRVAMEGATLARTVRVSDAVDARLDTVAATMRALGTVRSIAIGDWTEARMRSLDIAGLDSDWRNVTIADASDGRQFVNLRAGGAPPTYAPRTAQTSLPRTTGTVVFSGIHRDATGSYVMTALMRIGVGVKPRYVMRVDLEPRLVQRLLIKYAPQYGVTAVVDTDGMFIGRTMAWPSRLGRPATRYVRDAIRTGHSGFYRSVTYEGLESFTAFTTSSRTGWSVHVAVSSRLIDAPQYGWRLAATLAGLTGVALAIGLVTIILRLVAGRRVADERVQRADRLEAVGKLTGGIAHDFNNMLAIIIGSLDLAQRRLAKGNTDIVRHIDNAMDGANRAAGLTRRLLAFSRRQPLAPIIVDVNALIESTGELLRRTLAADIAMNLDLNPGLWPTFVDPGELENALVNLAVNARDAMPDGGRLTIRTANRSGRTDMVAIVVADDGTGMPADVAARASEPFFTTKEVGRGTGLGLSQIHGFTTQSGGELVITSKVGEGTEITLLLPRYAGLAVSEDVSTIKADQSAPSGSFDEVLLVVEDEEQVRTTHLEALRSLGYTVRGAADASEALAVLRLQSDIRLMLSDIVMPGMNGRELAARVAREYPRVRILLATGYEREQKGAHDERILHKPFGVGELARRVRGELDRVV